MHFLWDIGCENESLWRNDVMPCNFVDIYSLMTETTNSSETQFNFYDITRRNVPDDSKPYTLLTFAHAFYVYSSLYLPSCNQININ
jgi:hypothetical protein